MLATPSVPSSAEVIIDRADGISMTYGGRHPATSFIRASAVFIALALLASACTSDPAPDASPDTTVAPTTTAADGSPTTTASSSTLDDDEPPTEAPRTYAEPQPDDTPIPLRDDARSGVLDNGLEYLVLSNDSPGSSVSMRLVVKAGGVHEEPLGTGAAHFLEHMMFNGTERYPGNTLDAALRSIGAEIGPDFNAYTSDRVTVYQLDIEDRGDNVDIAMDVLVEWATAATITPEAVVDESGVVREELRVRDESGDGRIFVRFEEAYYADTPYEGVNVSGTADSVLDLTADDLRAFYDRWYHPEHLALIVVGDRSLDDLESLVVAAFDGVAGRGEPGVQPATGGAAFPTEPLVDTIVEPGTADSYISVDIPTRAWDQSTEGGYRAVLMEILAMSIVDQRLTEGVDSGRLDLRRGRASWFPFNVDLPFYGFNVDADDLESGTEVLMTELRSTLQNPFTDDEVDFFVEAFIEQNRQQLSQADTIQDRDLAAMAVRHVTDGAPFLTVVDSVEHFERLIRSISADDINEHHGWIMTNSQPLVLVVGPDVETVGTVEGHREALRRAAEATIDDDDDGLAEVEEIDVLVVAPDPIEPASSSRIANDEGVELVFDNGTRVLFCESDISAGQVFVVTKSPGGRVVLDADDGAVASVVAGAVSNSGLGPWDNVQIRRYLADIDANLAPYIADASEGFSGSASTEDVDTLFELLHLAITAPRVDEIPFAQQLEFARDDVAGVALDASVAASVAIDDLRTGGGALAATATPTQLDALTIEGAQRLIDDRVRHLDDHVIVVVGDIDAADVTDLASTWIGTLPAASDDPDVDEIPAEPGSTARITAGSGTSTGAWRWLAAAPGDETVRERVLAELATTVLNDRLFTVIREELGATYGGRAAFEFVEPGDVIELSITVDGDPARLDEIGDRARAELAAIATTGPTSADFSEAVAILQAEYNFINNGFFIEALFDYARRPDQVISRQAQVATLAGFRASDVAGFVSRFSESNDTYEVIARP